MQSPITVGILMIAVAGLGLAPIGPQPRPPIGVAQLVLTALLCLGGIALILKQRVAYIIALVAAGALILSSVLAWAGLTKLGPLLPPIMSLVIGLYLVLRIIMAKVAGGKPRGSLPPADDT